MGVRTSTLWGLCRLRTSTSSVLRGWMLDAGTAYYDDNSASLGHATIRTHHTSTAWTFYPYSHIYELVSCAAVSFGPLHKTLSEMPHPDTLDDVSLRVNDDVLGPSEASPLRASHPSEPMELLRQRYANDGYVFLKHLLPRQDVLSAREAYFSSMSPSGFLKPGTAKVDGIFDTSASAADFPGIGAGSIKNARPGSTENADVFTELALGAHTEPWYAGTRDGEIAGFANRPTLHDFVSRFSGWGEHTLQVKRSLLRNNTPGSKATGVHYDQSFMRHGEATAITAWVPMGHVRLDGGGLIYLEGGAYMFHVWVA